MGPCREVIYAAIDIGTNAVLLLVAEWAPHPIPLPQGERGIKVLRDEARITRLGEGLHDKPLFIAGARERTLKVLKGYRQICDSLGVQKIAAVGTAAFRKAKNAAEFIRQVKKEAGIKIEIISGDEEARLSFLSVQTDFSHHPNLIALDIGGGSTEIITKAGGVSLDLGAVVLTERIIKHDPATEDEVREIENEIDRIVGASFKPVPTNPTLVGLAGSVTTLSAIKQKLTVWDGAKVQGSILTLRDLNDMIPQFLRTTNEERRTIPGMVPGREDTILAGTLILEAVMKKVGVTEGIVSDRGLRYGLFYERFSNPGNS